MTSVKDDGRNGNQRAEKGDRMAIVQYQGPGTARAYSRAVRAEREASRLLDACRRVHSRRDNRLFRKNSGKVVRVAYARHQRMVLALQRPLTYQVDVEHVLRGMVETWKELYA